MSETALVYDDAAEPTLRPPRMPTFEDARLPHAGQSTGPRGDVHRMGMCVAVAADGVFFASLLGLSVAVRAQHPEIFGYGKYFLDARLGVLESSVLLASALSGTLTIRLSLERARGGFVAASGVTILLGLVFLALLGYETSGLAERGLAAGSRFTTTEVVWQTPAFVRLHPEAARYANTFRASAPRPGRKALREPTAAEIGPLVAAGVLGDRAVLTDVPSEPRNAHLFFGLFSLVTALHALHVVVGLGVWAWLLFQTRRAVPTHAAADDASIYWNLVALMRIALCPFFYFLQ